MLITFFMALLLAPSYHLHFAHTAKLSSYGSSSCTSTSHTPDPHQRSVASVVANVVSTLRPASGYGNTSELPPQSYLPVEGQLHTTHTTLVPAGWRLGSELKSSEFPCLDLYSGSVPEELQGKAFLHLSELTAFSTPGQGQGLLLSPLRHVR